MRASCRQTKRVDRHDPDFQAQLELALKISSSSVQAPPGTSSSTSGGVARQVHKVLGGKRKAHTTAEDARSKCKNPGCNYRHARTQSLRKHESSCDPSWHCAHCKLSRSQCEVEWAKAGLKRQFSKAGRNKEYCIRCSRLFSKNKHYIPASADGTFQCKFCKGHFATHKS